MARALTPSAPAFLASVTTADEALHALEAGADIIDAKDPSQGALGALDPRIIRDIVSAVAGRAPVSATIGDLPAEPGVMYAAAVSTAATGVDIVKIGFFGDSDPRAAIAALGRANLGSANLGQVVLVAVLMADRNPDFAILPALAAAGFAGVMLDTADKAAGALPDVLAPNVLSAFISDARRAGLSAGLAGSLRRAHIASLVNLGPDIIGFRGALCGEGRASALDGALVRAVRDDIDAAAAARARAQRSVA
jgi:(5-formylfuran-3-yl)methyl phosphate synthase